MILVRCATCGHVGSDEIPHCMTDATVADIIASSGYQFVCGKCQTINMLDRCLERGITDVIAQNGGWTPARGVGKGR